MAIRTIIDSISPQPNGTVQLVVVFVDEALGIKERLADIYVPASFTSDQIDDRLRNERTKLAASDTLAKTLTTGERDIDASMPPPTEVTDEEKARQAFLSVAAKVNQAKLYVDLGIVDPTSKEYTGLVTAAISLFKPEYVV